MNGYFPDAPALDGVELTPYIKRGFKLCSHVISEAPVGEHIAARKTNSDAWHHGVYMGHVADKEGFYVVDFDERGMIDMREVDLFCLGAEQIVSVGYDVYKAPRGARYNCVHFYSNVHARVTALLESVARKRETAPTPKFK
jgi:hypothetical protein